MPVKVSKKTKNTINLKYCWDASKPLVQALCEKHGYIISTNTSGILFYTDSEQDWKACNAVK